jgi:predicted aspartyl protease
MGTLVVPNFQGKQMGQLFTTITISNRIDQVLADRGFIATEEVRTRTLNNVLVDTGATLLCLPTTIISQLGLVQGKPVWKQRLESSQGRFSGC